MRTEKETTSVEIDVFNFFSGNVHVLIYTPEKNHIHGEELLGRVMG